MTAQCCNRGRASSRPARRFSTLAASVMPAALFVLLPKCPLCLAAWLTLATGISFSATGAAWVRAAVLLFWIVALGWGIRSLTVAAPLQIDGRRPNRDESDRPRFGARAAALSLTPR